MTDGFRDSGKGRADLGRYLLVTDRCDRGGPRRREEPAMRIVVWGSGIVESRMLWERGESTMEAQHLAETLSIAWEDIEGLERWALEIECPEPDDVLRLVEETSGDDAVLGWSPAPKEIPAAWFMSDDAYLPGTDW